MLLPYEIHRTEKGEYEFILNETAFNLKKAAAMVQ